MSPKPKGWRWDWKFGDLLVPMEADDYEIIVMFVSAQEEGGDIFNAFTIYDDDDEANWGGTIVPLSFEDWVAHGT